MRHTLSNLVVVFCLLAFVVSSAACLTPTPQPAHGMTMHSMGGEAHACCPRRAPAQSAVTGSCCTLHHQPASVTSAVQAPHTALAALPLAEFLPAATASLPSSALPAVIPLRLPPLIALRI
ncbi:MAG TPA: hypothetical protein VHN81_06315 [Edaphobacter sp.]|nr:hypothetical protein [Edaphobacter sp.]